MGGTRVGRGVDQKVGIGTTRGLKRNLSILGLRVPPIPQVHSEVAMYPEPHGELVSNVEAELQDSKMVLGHHEVQRSRLRLMTPN